MMAFPPPPKLPELSLPLVPSCTPPVLSCASAERAGQRATASNKKFFFLVANQGHASLSRPHAPLHPDDFLGLERTLGVLASMVINQRLSCSLRLPALRPAGPPKVTSRICDLSSLFQFNIGSLSSKASSPSPCLRVLCRVIGHLSQEGSLSFAFLQLLEQPIGPESSLLKPSACAQATRETDWALTVTPNLSDTPCMSALPQSRL